MNRVLIADDDHVIRLVVNATIVSDKYEVIEASDGEEAWTLVQKSRPTLALLDVGMPGLDGLTLTRRIKESPELAGTRVILLTAQTSPADVQAGKAAGADLYLTKPFSPLELLTAVEQVMGES